MRLLLLQSSRSRWGGTLERVPTGFDRKGDFLLVAGEHKGKTVDFFWTDMNDQAKRFTNQHFTANWKRKRKLHFSNT